MTNYILRRFLTMIPMLFGITLLSFFLMSLAPGNFLTPIKMQRDISPETIHALEHQFGLDQPWYVQYFLWLKNILHLDFGYSWTYKIPVGDLLASRIPATLLLAVSSLLISWAIALPIGILAAIKKDSWFDRTVSILAYGGLSVPEFFLALLGLFIAARTGLFPLGGITSIQYDFLNPGEKIVDLLHHLILPAIVLGIGNIAGTMRVMRASFLDVIRSEFVTAARAKGLSENAIMFRHVLRNALNPLITLFGFAFADLLSGALLVENVMNYPGLGQLIYQAYLRQDQFVVLGSVIMGSVMLILGNLLADLLLSWNDPRIRHA